MCWAQMSGEGQLGTGIKTVIQGYNVTDILKAVRIQWDDNNGILLTENLRKMVYEQYVALCAGIYHMCTLTLKVCTGIHQHEQGI